MARPTREKRHAKWCLFIAIIVGIILIVIGNLVEHPSFKLLFDERASFEGTTSFLIFLGGLWIVLALFSFIILKNYGDY